MWQWTAAVLLAGCLWMHASAKPCPPDAVFMHSYEHDADVCLW